MDWIVGLSTVAIVGFGAWGFAHTLLESGRKHLTYLDRKKAMIMASSWDGDGRGVHCAMCGCPLNEDTIEGMDEDGNGYCGKHTRKATS